MSHVRHHVAIPLSEGRYPNQNYGNRGNSVRAASCYRFFTTGEREEDTEVVIGLSRSTLDHALRYVRKPSTPTPEPGGSRAAPPAMDRFAGHGGLEGKGHVAGAGYRVGDFVQDLAGERFDRRDSSLAPSKIGWRTHLEGVVRSGLSWAAGKVDHTYRRPSRRSRPGGVILPTMQQPRPRLITVLDTSGSMSATHVTAALSEIEGICNRAGLRGDDHRVTCVDADAHDLQRVTSARDIDLRGGGGTDILALDARPRPDVIIIVMSDATPHGHRPFPLTSSSSSWSFGTASPPRPPPPTPDAPPSASPRGPSSPPSIPRPDSCRALGGSRRAPAGPTMCESVGRQCFISGRERPDQQRSVQPSCQAVRRSIGVTHRYGSESRWLREHTQGSPSYSPQGGSCTVSAAQRMSSKASIDQLWASVVTTMRASSTQVGQASKSAKTSVWPRR